MRNTWAICREVGDNSLKGELIPDVTTWEASLGMLKSGTARPDAS